MGWYVASPQIINRLERASEVSTGAPAGFSQMLLGKLLSEEWGVSGYLRWLKGVKSLYRARRNDFIDLLLAQPGVGMEVRLSSAGAFEFSVSPSVTKSPLAALSYDNRILYSFVPPAGGMFGKRGYIAFSARLAADRTSDAQSGSECISPTTLNTHAAQLRSCLLLSLRHWPSAKY